MNAYTDLVNYIRHAGTRLRQFPGTGVTLLTVTRIALCRKVTSAADTLLMAIAVLTQIATTW